MKRLLSLMLVLFSVSALNAQSVLTLDSCRTMAMENNKDLQIAREKMNAAKYEKKAAFTKFFPSISGNATYMYNQKEISLLSEDQKLALGNLGEKPGAAMNEVKKAIMQLVMSKPELAPILAPLAGLDITGPLNQLGQSLTDALRTDTHNVFGAAFMFTQPIFMGGKIIAYNKITRYAEQLAATQHNSAVQDVILSTDQAYWQVVSLAYKQKLAEGYLELLKKLEGDVEKLVAEGVATKADELSVKVKVNEAEMTLSQVNDGLVLSRMVLCQVCGIELDSQFTLADELVEELGPSEAKPEVNVEQAVAARPEITSLELASKIYKQKVNVTRSEYLPTIALTGGYIMSNPSLFNGFETKVRGMWNVGVVASVPLCNWGGGILKTKAAKSQALIAQYTLQDAREKIELQINQASFKVDESNKKLAMARKNLDHAEENLRYAALGFKEGVIPASNDLEAHTAWLKANSEYIDAQIEVKMNDIYLKKALGILAR